MRVASLRSLVVVGLALAACASSGDVNSPYASSPQFKDGLFANPPNPLTPPSASAWANWSRFLFGTKVDTVPVDPIPVRPLTRGQLDALDPGANHLVRLGHSSHLLKLQGKFWLIDPVFGERASPVSFAGPKRFHRPPLTLEELPPIEGLILSHDHYDHLDVPTIEHLAKRCSATSCRSASRRGWSRWACRRSGCRSSTGGRRASMPAFASRRRRHSTSPDAR
jgi:hypothetical protein